MWVLTVDVWCAVVAAALCCWWCRSSQLMCDALSLLQLCAVGDVVDVWRAAVAAALCCWWCRSSQLMCNALPLLQLCSVGDVGRHSWWATSRGSWFVESLCQELRDAMSVGGVIDIEQVLTRVRFQVAYNQETSSSNKALCGKKQMPCMYSTLTKQLHLPCLHWTACRLFVSSLLPCI